MTVRAILDVARLPDALGSYEAAEQAFFASLAAVGAQLQIDDRRSMAAELPLPIGDALLDPVYRGPAPAETVYAEVAALCGLSSGQAGEIVQTVIQTLAEALPANLRERLARHSDSTFRPLWNPPSLRSEVSGPSASSGAYRG